MSICLLLFRLFLHCKSSSQCRTISLSQEQNFTMITKCLYTPDSFCLMSHSQAKVNNASLIGVGYTQTLRPGNHSTLDPLVGWLTAVSSTLKPERKLQNCSPVPRLVLLRREGDPLCTHRRQELQHWRTQSWTGL